MRFVVGLKVWDGRLNALLASFAACSICWVVL